MRYIGLNQIGFGLEKLYLIWLSFVAEMNDFWKKKKKKERVINYYGVKYDYNVSAKVFFFYDFRATFEWRQLILIKIITQ